MEIDHQGTDVSCGGQPVGSTDVTVDITKPISLRKLEDHLWAAADLFRNKVSNQKDYILALLFFKRASDLYKEETAEALAQLGDVEGARDLAHDRAFHALEIPSDNSWDKVRGTDAAKMGQALNDALAAIGRANPKQLAGVFERTDFNDQMALPADDLVEVVEHFHKLGPLDSRRVSADMLGQAYEWLIAKFAAAAGKGGGEFYTPAEVGQLMAELIEPGNGEHINDPTCGSGGLLLQCVNRARERGRDVRSLFLYGQELNPETWAIARMNMLLHGVGDASEIKLGDTLASPAFTVGDRLKTFDVVVANPPFSSKNWGHERLKTAGDKFGRIKHLPPKTHGEMAFVQHMIASLNERGRLAVVLPNGVFFRGGAELSVRRDLIEKDLVEAIIQLPKDLFYGATIPACVLVCNRAKPESRARRVLFIDASEGFVRRDTKNVLTSEAIKRVAAAFHAGDPLEGFAAWASREKIAEIGYNLTVRRYVRSRSRDELVDLDTSAAALESAIAQSREADGDVLQLLQSLSMEAR
ncbi:MULTISPECIES: type I restriction-modification system subunit M [Streptomyces]|uniref:type I restriction-modification system subunit M n=1 Tax=Streptomyces TaxID=1883 RepID=UPI002248CE5C|nr:class I SAM-dependent DNA methyltransferase [Streptomyces sp. JHD 1]MCX2969481.1 class I SAM-dependent DNA methyltransferase [Streptomyces sp. JHD 1]